MTQYEQKQSRLSRRLEIVELLADWKVFWLVERAWSSKGLLILDQDTAQVHTYGSVGTLRYLCGKLVALRLGEFQENYTTFDMSCVQHTDPIAWELLLTIYT